MIMLSPKSKGSKKVKSKVTKNAIIGKIDQGTIFNGAIAEDYNDCEVMGLIITASCDIANDKVKKYSYLPVVKFNDWLRRDSWEIFFHRTAQQERSNLRNLFIQKGLSANLIEQFDHNTLYQKLSEDFAKKEKDRFKKIIKKIEDITICNNSGLKDKIQLMDKILANQKKLVLSIFNELTSHNLSGYYFLEAISPDDGSGPYVILLREIRHLNRNIIKGISKGLSPEELGSHVKNSIQNALNIDIAYSEMMMPLGHINPPYIQHIMQNFSELFSRIGVDDFDKSLNEKLFESSVTV